MAAPSSKTIDPTLRAGSILNIGFAQGFNAKTTQTWQHYKKVLYLYACGKNGLRMSEKRFLELLSGFSIEGEFEALVK